MTMRPCLILVMLPAFLSLPSRLEACDCVPHKPCEPFQSQGSLFLAEVISVKTIMHPERLETQTLKRMDNLYTVRVIERLEGSEKPDQLVMVETPSGGADCGFPFRIGAKYLIDARQVFDKYLTSLCTLTGLEEDRMGVLYEVRARLAGRRPPDLSGSITKDDLLTTLPKGVSMSGIDVQIRGEKAGAQFRTTSGTDGYYRFDKIPSDNYLVSLDGLPAGFSVGASNLEPNMQHEIPPIHVDGSKLLSSTCHLDMEVLPAGRIAGNIQASANVLANSSVSAYRVDQVTGRAREIRVDFPAENGSFALGFLPEGQYQIRVERLSRKGLLAVQEITLKPGESKTDLAMVVK